MNDLSIRKNIYCLKPSIKLVEGVGLNFIRKNLHANERENIVVDYQNPEQWPQTSQYINASTQYGVHDFHTWSQMDEAEYQKHVHNTRYAPNARGSFIRAHLTIKYIVQTLVH